MNPTIDYQVIEDIPSLKEVVTLQEVTWGTESVTSLAQLVATVRNGGVVIGGFCDGKLIGFCYGFPGYVEKRVFLVSHMMAIHPQYRNLGIGEKLKHLQKDWANRNGFEKITWTFDPLESRNAYLNIHKLGAYVRKYYPLYYGEMNDNINKGLPADRFLVEWDIVSSISYRKDFDLSKTVRLVEGDHSEAFVRPFYHAQELRDSYYLVAVPPNIHQMKSENISLAEQWRYTLRDVFIQLFENHYAVIDMVKGYEGDQVPYYVVGKIG
jgi:predicted GNAT superfamily acetyltransferase